MEAELARARPAAEAYRQSAESAVRHQKANTELLGIRTAELEAVHNFITPLETVADARIVELVQELNYEISQVTPALSESYDGIARRNRAPDLLQFAPPTLRQMRVDRVADMLAQIHPDDAVTNLTIAIQGRLAYLTTITIRQWRFEEQSGLSTIFHELQNKGKHATYLIMAHG
jgi:hypothetical protein